MENNKKQTPFSGLLYNKKFLFLISLIMAVIFWLVITITQNPTRSMSISNIPVTINTEGTVVSELGLGIVGDYTDEVTVKVSGPSYIVSGLTNNDIMVTASLAEVKGAGSYKLSLTAARGGNTSGYTIVSVKPAEIDVTFDEFDTKTFNLVAVANGASAVEGLVAESAVITDSEQSAVILSGPQSEMNQIAEVRAVADVNKILSETTSYQARLVSVDKDGNELNLKNITYPDETITISVPISKKKSVSVVPSFINVPKGYEKSVPHSLSTATVTVIGPPEKIDEISSVGTEDIDFANIDKTNKSFDVPLVLPNGVKIIENIEFVTVKVKIDDIGKKTFIVDKISASNLGKGLSANISSPIEVTICGEKQELKNLKVDRISLVIDAAASSAGEYTFDAKISIKNSKKVWGVGTYQVTATLK